MIMANGNIEKLNVERKRQGARAIMATCSAVAWMNERRITAEGLGSRVGMLWDHRRRRKHD